jgi:hypothetical protein
MATVLIVSTASGQRPGEVRVRLRAAGAVPNPFELFDRAKVAVDGVGEPVRARARPERGFRGNSRSLRRSRPAQRARNPCAVQPPPRRDRSASCRYRRAAATRRQDRGYGPRARASALRRPVGATCRIRDRSRCSPSDVTNCPHGRARRRETGMDCVARMARISVRSGFVRAFARPSDLARRCGRGERARTGADAVQSRQARGHWFEPSTTPFGRLQPTVTRS